MGYATRHISPAKRMIPGKDTPLSVIIPAAGNSKRMKSKESKILSSFNETTIIERQLNLIWETFPKSEIFLVVGEQVNIIRKRLKNYPVRFIYNPIYENTNVAFSIGLGLQASITKEVLVVYGDLIFNKEAISDITREETSKVLIDSNYNINDDEVGLILDNNNIVTNLSYGLKDKWSQIAYLRDRELELFKEACYDDYSCKWFGYEALNQVIDKNGMLFGFKNQSALVFDIDTQQDLLKAQRINNV